MSPARWWPGEATVAVSGTGALAFDGAREVLEPLWQQLDAGAGLSDLLRQLVMAYDGSVLALPEFLLVVAQEAGWRAVARGRFRLLDANGAVLLHAPSPVAWEEAQIPAGTQLVLDLDGPSNQEAGWLLRAGIVPASRLSLSTADADPQVPAVGAALPTPSEAGTPVQATVPEPAAAPEAESPASLEAAAQVTPSAPEPVYAALETSQPAPIAEQAEGLADSEDSSLLAPVASPGPEPEAAPADPATTQEPELDPLAPVDKEPHPSGEELTSSATLGPEHLDLIGADDALEPEAPAEEFSDYAHHYGDHTIAVNVAEAAIRELEEDVGIVTAVPKAGQPTPSASVPAAAPAGIPVPALVSEVPQAAGADASAPAQPAAPALVEEPDWMHDGHTVAGAQLRRSRPGAHVAEPTAQPSPADLQGTVLAVLCPAEHPNTVTALSCRVCGMPVNGPSVRVPRPVLGRLRTSSQEEMQLSSDVIIGRSPQATPRPGEAMPQLLAVACPDKAVSKTHCAVRVDGWDLLVEDLGSTNGTFLLRRGEAPRRVTRGTPVPLQIGDVLDLADSVTITVEAVDA